MCRFDIDKGEEVVITDGKVWEAVRASSSIPVIFTPMEWRGRNLVDGLLLNPYYPTKNVRDMGEIIMFLLMSSS